MKIAISTESTADLTKDMIKRHNIFVLPFHIILGDEDFLDDEKMNSEKLFEFVKKTNTLPKTAAISEFEYEEHFKKLLKSHDKVLHFTLSSKMSVSNTNASKAAKKLEGVEVVDSKSLSTGIGLLVMFAIDKINEGKSFEEVLKQTRQKVELVKASFVINNLKYLHKGGRCSSVALLGANILKIKPEIVVNNGEMSVGKKYRGKHSEVLAKYTKEVLEGHNPDKKRAFVTYSSKPAFADQMIKFVKDFGFEEVYETNAGATIATHCGPETIGILFIDKGSEKWK